MHLSPTERVDALNIGLVFLSAAMAMVIPFELFLFSYAIMGPLHYLTEISWLHDRKYFTHHRYDAWILGTIALILGIIYVNVFYQLGLEIPPTLPSNIGWFGLLLAILFVLVKNNLYRLLGVLVIILTLKVSTWPTTVMIITVLLPTLIHVFLFTGLFMLYGALKSKSRLGLVTVAAFVLCPFLLFMLFPGREFFSVTSYGVNAYTGGERYFGFQSLNIELLGRFFDFTIRARDVEEAKQMWNTAIFHSPEGIVIARFIAFAYTYHYLNWFSKTKVIQWHKVPKSRFAFVIAAWLISLSLYIYDYTLGLVWLFFLSYLHVILEFPLNVTSVTGIFKSLRGSRGNAAPQPASAQK
jgi:hypothetical protein